MSDSLFSLEEKTRSELLGSLIKKLVKQQPERFLDIGCDSGLLTSLLADDVREVHGCDVSKDAIFVAQEVFSDKKCKWRVASADALPYEDDYFDHVFMIDLLHHVPAGQHQRCIDEALRVLQRGGIIVIVESKKKEMNSTVVELCSDGAPLVTPEQLIPLLPNTATIDVGCFSLRDAPQFDQLAQKYPEMTQDIDVEYFYLVVEGNESLMSLNYAYSRRF